MDDAEVRHNQTQHRFEAGPNGALGVATYGLRDGVMTLVHTEVAADARGHGVGDRLAVAALGYARASHYRVIPRCRFMATYIARHPEHQDLVIAST